MRIWSRASAMAGAAMTRPVRAATASLLLITGDTSAECLLLNFAASLALPHPAHGMPKALRCIHRPLDGGVKLRAEERRVGKECVRMCRSRGSRCHLKKKKEKHK